jgi:SAM-dependent methyltransferase
MNELTPVYWGNVLEEVSGTPLFCWRNYMRFVYCKLITAWFKDPQDTVALKTDLFEEAITEHCILPSLGAHSIGLDHSLGIVLAAKKRLYVKPNSYSLLVCDLRNLPLQTASIQQILSGSSLDHFTKKDDIDLALRELMRVMVSGGVLVLTLDNPANPIVWLRNHLPFSWLHKLGLVPYYVGPTCSAPEAREKLEAAGFKVTDCTAVAHFPRAPAIWFVHLCERFGKKGMMNWFGRLMETGECLERWPTKYQTGYYIALRAIKCRN